MDDLDPRFKQIEASLREYARLQQAWEVAPTKADRELVATKMLATAERAKALSEAIAEDAAKALAEFRGIDLATHCIHGARLDCWCLDCKRTTR